jgi:hypothetical protein
MQGPALRMAVEGVVGILAVWDPYEYLMLLKKGN